MRNIVFLLLLVPIAGVLGVCVSVPLADEHWTFDLLAQLLPPAFVGGIIAALIAAMLRLWRLAIAAAVAAVAAYAIAEPWTRGATFTNPEANPVRLLLYNVWVGNRALDKVAAKIMELDADIVVLLEIIPEMRDALRPLDASYPHRFECWQTRGCDGLVFSRFPLKEPHVDFTGPPDRSPIAWIETNIDGCALNLFLTHMTRPFPHRPFTAQFKQADDLGALLRGWPGPKLVVGDFNAVPWGHVMKTIANQANLRISLGQGGTWPSILPPLLRLPIDHVLATEGIALANRKVVDLPGSDHTGVLTQVVIEDRGRCG